MPQERKSEYNNASSLPAGDELHYLQLCVAPRSRLKKQAASLSRWDLEPK